MGQQLFLIDPVTRLRPEKDSSVALMQAGQRAGETIWVAEPSDLMTKNTILYIELL